MAGKSILVSIQSIYADISEYMAVHKILCQNVTMYLDPSGYMLIPAHN